MLVDTSGFIGPTLAASGVSFLVPLTRPKLINVTIPNFPDAVATTNVDQQFVGLIWLLILGSLFAWSASCYASIKVPSELLIGIPVHAVIGFTTYFVSLMMTFIKGKI
jgi:hypothetical protein